MRQVPDRHLRHARGISYALLGLLALRSYGVQLRVSHVERGRREDCWSSPGECPGFFQRRNDLDGAALDRRLQTRFACYVGDESEGVWWAERMSEEDDEEEDEEGWGDEETEE